MGGILVTVLGISSIGYALAYLIENKIFVTIFTVISVLILLIAVPALLLSVSATGQAGTALAAGAFGLLAIFFGLPAAGYMSGRVSFSVWKTYGESKKPIALAICLILFIWPALGLLFF